MGMTPLEGLVMGTRSGDVDPAVVLHLVRVGGMTVDEVDELLNKRSGLLGLCGDNDMREIRRRVEEGDESAQLAFDVYVHRLKKYIGAYFAVLGRLDAVAFTAEWARIPPPVRRAALAGLEGLGLLVDPGSQRGGGRGGGRSAADLPEGARGSRWPSYRPTKSWRSHSRPTRWSAAGRQQPGDRVIHFTPDTFRT